MFYKFFSLHDEIYLEFKINNTTVFGERQLLKLKGKRKVRTSNKYGTQYRKKRAIQKVMT